MLQRSIGLIGKVAALLTAGTNHALIHGASGSTVWCSTRAIILDWTSAAPSSRRRSPVFDDAEILPDLPFPRWPLHPTPLRFERLDTYVCRLAEIYGIGFRTFCRHALGGGADEIGLLVDQPAPVMLERLSAGTGLPFRRFQNMTREHYHARVAAAFRWIVRHNPELVHKGFGKVSRQASFVDSI